MPYVLLANGQARYVPGVYVDVDVVQDLPGQPPDFLIPILMGGAQEGHPYNANGLKYSEEADYTPFQLCGTRAVVQSYFGPSSLLQLAMGYAKRHGLPFAYVSCLGALTRFSVPVTSTGPVVQFTLYGKRGKWGAPLNHYRIAAPLGTSLQVTPVKNYAMLTVTASSTGRRLYVTDNSWVKVGASIYIGDNSTADAALTVYATGVEPTSTGQDRYYVDVTTNIGSAFATSAYAMIYDLDTARREDSPVFTKVQDLMDWINANSSYFGAHKESATFTNPAAVIAISSATVAKEISAWGSVVPGTSPAPTSGDYTAFVALMDASAWDQFVTTYGVLPRAFCVTDPSSTVHATMRDWAIDMRGRGYPISLNVGCEWGDIDLTQTNDTNPIVRARALDSQDVMLAAGGLDRISAALSFNPAIFGMRIGGGIAHNLTNDPLIGVGSFEVRWDEWGLGQLTALHKGGVDCYRLSVSGSPRYVLSEGLSTLQNNQRSWNVVTKDTCLVMQRDIVDFIVRDVTNELDQFQLGVDVVNASSVAAAIQGRLDYFQNRRVLITQYRIDSVRKNPSGAGWDPVWTVEPITTTDFIVGRMHVLVGE